MGRNSGWRAWDCDFCGKEYRGPTDPRGWCTYMVQKYVVGVDGVGHSELAMCADCHHSLPGQSILAALRRFFKKRGWQAPTPEPHPWKRTKIKLNGGELFTTLATLSYEDVIWLGGMPEGTIASVIYHSKSRGSGSLTPGKSIEVEDGLDITAMVTGDA